MEYGDNILGAKHVRNLLNMVYGSGIDTSYKTTNSPRIGMEGVVKAVRITDKNTILGIDRDVIDQIARDAAKRALEMTEEELLNAQISDYKWIKLVSEKDLPTEKVGDFVIVRNVNIAMPWVVKRENLVKKSERLYFFDLQKFIQVHYWCKIPEFAI